MLFFKRLNTQNEKKKDYSCPFVSMKLRKKKLENKNEIFTKG